MDDEYTTKLKWLERNGCYNFAAGGEEVMTPKEVARRYEIERKESCERIVVKGYDTSLPEDDIKSALTNHFSSCGEILYVEFSRAYNTKSTMFMYIKGEGAKEKAEQLDGSHMGGCKLVVNPWLKPILGRPRPRPDYIKLVGYLPPPKDQVEAFFASCTMTFGEFRRGARRKPEDLETVERKAERSSRRRS